MLPRYFNRGSCASAVVDVVAAALQDASPVVGHPSFTKPNRDEGVNNRSRQTARRAPRVASSSRNPKKCSRRTPLQFHTPTPTTFFRQANTGAYTDTPRTSVSAELYCVLLLRRYIIALELLHLDSGAHHRKCRDNRCQHICAGA